MSDTFYSVLVESGLLLNAVGEGIYGFDTDGRAIFINPAAEKMTGWASGELLGENIHEYHHHSHEDGSHYPSCDCPIYATAKDGKSRTVKDEVFWRKDGSHFAVEYTSTPVLKDGKLIGAVAVFRDVSEQKAIQKQLEDALNTVQDLSEKLKAENTYLQQALDRNWEDKELIGQSPAFSAMMEQIHLVASADSGVLIQGESGTGKELVADAIHKLSLRNQAPLIKINCAAFTPSLLESELFGHEKGAFTGAMQRRKGCFELADGGTLFLDEIGELTPQAQSKLLRVIQQQEFERVGGSQKIKVNVRLIAATNRDLRLLVQEQKFRLDLFYRLNVFPIDVPALRHRADDIPLIVGALIQRFNQRLGKNIQGVSSKSLKVMMAYAWPGNIRELQNMIEREMLLAKGAVIHLQSMGLQPETGVLQHKSLKKMESEYIQEVLADCQGRISGPNGAAAILELPESTLRSKMKKLGISRK